MSAEPLKAHSIYELQLYIMVTPCQNCGQGRLRCHTEKPVPSTTPFTVKARCEACAYEHQMLFTLPEGAGVDDRDNLYPVINPTNNPSQILDVGQWIVLFRIILEAASKEKAKIEARRLGYEAAQCLAEAIKFYDDNDLPPDRAVFCESTRRRLRRHPEQFSRQNLIEMRSRLPQLTSMETVISRDTRRKRAGGKYWWRFW